MKWTAQLPVICDRLYYVSVPLQPFFFCYMQKKVEMNKLLSLHVAYRHQSYRTLKLTLLQAMQIVNKVH